MTNVLFLGTKIKLLPIYDYLKVNPNYDIKFLRFGDNTHENDYEEFINLSEKWNFKIDFFKDWIPDQIINLKEQKNYLNAERQISEAFGLDTFLDDDNIEFFSCKIEQDKVFRSLNIPTVPNNSKTVLQKSNWSGGTGFKVVSREKAKGFFQDYKEIDYIISCHLYSDGNYWYHLNNHIMYYEDNCPKQSYTPYVISKEDYSIIEDSIKKLSKNIRINNRLFGWQFMKTKEGQLYSIDFNLRPFGGFDKGSYDWDVSDQNWIKYIFGKTPPQKIVYTHSVECIYKNKQQFGYAPWDRVKTALKTQLIYEIKKMEIDNEHRV